MKKSCRVLICLLTLLRSSAFAAPTSITYQGSLKQSGVPVNATVTMSFSITNSACIPYWSSGNQSVSVKEGLYRVELTPTNVDWANVDPYIQVSVNNAALNPCEKIGNTPYAMITKDVMGGGSVKGDLQVNGRTNSAKSDSNTTFSNELGTLRLQNTSSTPNNFAGTSLLEANGNPVAYAGAQIRAHSAASTNVAGDYVIATKTIGPGGYPVPHFIINSNGTSLALRSDANTSMSSEIGTQRLQNTAANPYNYVGTLLLESNGNPVAYAGAKILAHSAASASVAGGYVIATKQIGVGGNPAERFYIDDKGNVALGQINTQQGLKVDVDNKGFYPLADQQWSLGRGGNQWTSVWAINGTIQTSSSFLKSNIREINLGPKSGLVPVASATSPLMGHPISASNNPVSNLAVPRGILFKWKKASETKSADADYIGFMGDDLPLEAHALREDGTRDPEHFYASAVIGILCAKVRAQDEQIKELMTRVAQLEQPKK